MYVDNFNTFCLTCLMANSLKRTSWAVSFHFKTIFALNKYIDTSLSEIEFNFYYLETLSIAFI